jgi:hypothetical protein
MTVSTPQPTQQDDTGPHIPEALRDLIGEKVVHAIGFPDDLLWIHVKPLWKGRFRVNVFVGKDATSARVAHSYFVVADDEGDIITSSPELVRRYLPPVPEVDETPVGCS